MRVNVKLFAIVRDRAGVGQIDLDLPPAANVNHVREQLEQRFAALEGHLARVAWAVNLEYASLDTVLHEGDEVAVIPAVSGG